MTFYMFTHLAKSHANAFILFYFCVFGYMVLKRVALYVDLDCVAFWCTYSWDFNMISFSVCFLLYFIFIGLDAL